MAIRIGLVYLWFGGLKYFSGLSPAEGLAKETIHELTFGLLQPDISLLLLALWETGVGICLLFGLWPRIALWVALFHISLTFTPLIFFPEAVWTQAPLGLTLLGQYIVKNLIILGALLVLLRNYRYTNDTRNRSLGFH